MSIKATVQEVRVAHAAFTRIFEEVKLTGDALWDATRLLGKLKGPIKDFERAQLKLYKDAGGIVDGRGISMDVLQPQQDGEALEDYEKRRDAYRTRANGLSEEIERLNEREVEIDAKPLTRSTLPKERKNDKGEKEQIEYRATDLANVGPFLADE